MNKKTLKITFIVMIALTLAFLILGLILIGATNIGTGDKQNGFYYLKNAGIGTVLSNDSFSAGMKLIGQTSQLNTLRAGTVFAVILTPIFFGFSLLVGGYYFFKFKK